jgi:hypothetical protein
METAKIYKKNASFFFGCLLFFYYIYQCKQAYYKTHTLLTDKHNGCNAGRIPVVNGKVGLD